MSRYIFAGILFSILFPYHSFSQFRKYSNEFLNIGAGARGLAMGSAQVATVNNGTAGYWNPAGLVNIKDNPEINLMHAAYFSGIGKYDYGSVAIPIQDNKRVVALSILRFAVDDIPNTLYLVEPDGSINYNNVQTFSSADYALLLSFAQKVTLQGDEDKSVDIGVNAKIIYRKVGSFATALGFGIDIGAQMRIKKWRLGLVAKDVTTTFNAWSFNFSEKEKEVLYLTNNAIPVKSTELTAPRIIAGGGYNFTINKSVDLLAEASLSLTFDGKRNTLISTNPISIDPSIGLEATINKVFFVRAGVTNFQRALSDGDLVNQKKTWIFQPSLGAGFNINNVSIDYAFSNLANQSNPLYTHVFSLRLNLIKKKTKEN